MSLKMSRILLALLIFMISISSTANLTDDNFEKAKKCLGKRESNNNYSIINSLGYLGRYQFGAQALEDIKFLKRGCYIKYKNRMPKKCWTGIYGVNSKKDFLKSKYAQDIALKMNFYANYRRLIKKDILTKESTQVRKAEALFVSHLLGVNGAYKYFKKNINKKDGYGTQASEYAKLARTCIGEYNEK